MNRKLQILALAATISGSALAQDMQLQRSNPVQKQIPGKEVLMKSAEKRGIKSLPSVIGRTEGNTLNPEMRKAPLRLSSREGYVIYEDFEDWDTVDEAWLPAGWTIDHKDSPQSNRGWKMTKPLYQYDYIDSKCLTYELFDDEVDEWVITPEFTVAPGMELCWSTMTSPYYFDWDYIDTSKGMQDEYVQINDMIINVSSDGGQTWTPIFSHAEKLMEESGGNFFNMFNYTVRPFTASLEDFVGERVVVGFQIVGHGGNTTFLDDVSIGLPPTNTSYVRPLSNLFFGLTDTDENVPASIMAGPVYQPVRYSNTTPVKNADFVWEYEDTEGENVSYDKDLYVTYTTDYTSEATTRNNMYPFPVLYGSSESTAPDEFTYPGFYQAGGRGEYERYFVDTQDYEVIQLGLTIIDPITEGSATYADIALPYFGYNQESDRFWSQYTFGNDYDDANWSHLEKFGDFFYTPDTPLVIEGIRTNAYGKISRNTVFTVEIYPLNAGYQIADTPLATAICTGNDIKIVDFYSASDFLGLNFKFDEPVVISKSQAPYFLVAIGGFRDAENVQYFSPEMSNYSNPNNLGLGWTGHQMCWGGEMLPFSWSPVANYTNDELVSFYIMLDAIFPWLESSENEVTVAPGSSKTLTLDSYYDAKDLEITGLPLWLTARISGRYDKTVVTFSASNQATDVDSATVTISGPGVSKVINVNTGTSGVDEINADTPKGEGVVYTLDGRRVGAGNLTPGIYIIRYPDGSTNKFIQK